MLHPDFLLRLGPRPGRGFLGTERPQARPEQVSQDAESGPKKLEGAGRPGLQRRSGARGAPEPPDSPGPSGSCLVPHPPIQPWRKTAPRRRCNPGISELAFSNFCQDLGAPAGLLVRLVEWKNSLGPRDCEGTPRSPAPTPPNPPPSRLLCFFHPRKFLPRGLSEGTAGRALARGPQGFSPSLAPQYGPRALQGVILSVDKSGVTPDHQRIWFDSSPKSNSSQFYPFRLSHHLPPTQR